MNRQPGFVNREEMSLSSVIWGIVFSILLTKTMFYHVTLPSPEKELLSSGLLQVFCRFYSAVHRELCYILNLARPFVTTCCKSYFVLVFGWLIG